MFSKLFGNAKPARDTLRADREKLIHHLRRAMKIHGVNSLEAKVVSRKLDDIEKMLA